MFQFIFWNYLIKRRKKIRISSIQQYISGYLIRALILIHLYLPIIHVIDLRALFVKFKYRLESLITSNNTFRVEGRFLPSEVESREKVCTAVSFNITCTLYFLASLASLPFFPLPFLFLLNRCRSRKCRLCPRRWPSRGTRPARASSS